MLKIITLLWVFLIFQKIRSVNSTCQAKTDIGNILQDSITLHFDKTRSKYNFQYPGVLYQNSIPKLALTINKFQFRNLSDIQYHIVTIFNSSTIVFHLVFPSSPVSWKNFRISFWVIGSSFTNLDIGYVSFENIQKQSTKTQLHYIKDQPFISKIRGIGQAVIFTSSFLGLSAVSHQQLEIKINSKIQKNISETVLSSQYYIQLSVQTGKQTKVKLIRYSYILYTPSRLQNMKYQYFSLTNSLIPELGTELNRYRTLLPQKLIIYPVLYGLIGVKGIKIIGLQAISLDMRLEAGNVQFLEFSFVSRIQSVQTNTLIIGQDMMMACINCPESFVKYADPLPICVGKNQCTDEEVSITDKDGIYSSCRKCLGNSVVVKKGNTKYCECPKGFITQPDGTCRKMIVYKSLAQQCPDPNSIRDSVTKKCICKQGYSLDQFGFCFGCEKNTSYWDLNLEKCLCLPGFQKDQSKNICILIGQTCGMNKIYRQGKCQCDQFTIKIQRNKKLECIECSSGTYKAEDKNQCNLCHQSCRECISQQFCLACTKGYYFAEFKCQARCGDGYKVTAEACDDGNLLNKDGCSENCMIQQGFLCNLDPFNKSKCEKRSLNNTNKIVPSQNKPSQYETLTPSKIIQPITQSNMTEKQNSSNSSNIISPPQIKNQSISQNITSNNFTNLNLNTNTTNKTINMDNTKMNNYTNITNITNITNTLKGTNINNGTDATNGTNLTNSTSPQTEYKVTVSKDSPKYISAGIVVELQVKPQKKRSQQQLNNMIKIIVSERRGQPSRVYITQDQNRLSSIRCLLSYNNMLPAVNFNFKIFIRFDENIWKSVTLYSQVFSKMSKSLRQ